MSQIRNTANKTKSSNMNMNNRKTNPNQTKNKSEKCIPKSSKCQCSCLQTENKEKLIEKKTWNERLDRNVSVNIRECVYVCKKHCVRLSSNKLLVLFFPEQINGFIGIIEIAAVIRILKY